jgi:hypothetical protein
MQWLGIYGFDRHKKQFNAVWVDSLNTSTETGVGEADKTGRILSFKGEHYDPRVGGMSRFIWRISHDGQSAMTIEMVDVGKDGKETLMMKVRGQRVK